jgi:hypothetical protein
LTVRLKEKVEIFKKKMERLLCRAPAINPEVFKETKNRNQFRFFSVNPQRQVSLEAHTMLHKVQNGHLVGIEAACIFGNIAVLNKDG